MTSPALACAAGEILYKKAKTPRGVFAEAVEKPVIARSIANWRGNLFLKMFLFCPSFQGNNNYVPKIDSHEFDLSQINDALQLVPGGHINGKVILRFL